MRVLAVAHVLRLGPLHRQHIRVGTWFTFEFSTRQVVANCRVVGGGVREGFFRERETRLSRKCACIGFHLVSETSVIATVDDDGYAFPVFRRSAHHRRAADIDVFNRVFERAARLRHGFAEWVEVHHDEIDQRNVCRRHRAHVLGQQAIGEDAAVHFRVQRLHAPVEHFREAGVIADVDHFQAGVADQLRGAARG